MEVRRQALPRFCSGHTISQPNNESLTRIYEFEMLNSAVTSKISKDIKETPFHLRWMRGPQFRNQMSNLSGIGTRLKGFEPPAYGFEVRRSFRLSYRRNYIFQRFATHGYSSSSFWTVFGQSPFEELALLFISLSAARSVRHTFGSS